MAKTTNERTKRFGRRSEPTKVEVSFPIVDESEKAILAVVATVEVGDDELDVKMWFPKSMATVKKGKVVAAADFLFNRYTNCLIGERRERDE